jgi:hypothetical protein
MKDHITIAGHDGAFAAYIARPKTVPAPAVIVLQEQVGYLVGLCVPAWHEETTYAQPTDWILRAFGERASSLVSPTCWWKTISALLR